jgi:cytochrome c oxidase subunit 1
VVQSRTPLWDNPDEMTVATGLRTDQREVIVTTAVEAKADSRDPQPDPSIWPLLTALATTPMLIGSIYTPNAIVWGAPFVAIALIGWLYPRKILAPVPEQVRDMP